MIIGIPKEIKKYENRIALLPSGAEALIKQGHSVLIENNAGVASSFSNEEYLKYGAKIVFSPQEVYGQADIIAKVKEPQAEEFPLIRKNQIVFTFFHFASSEALTRAIIDTHSIAIAYETIQLANGSLPVLIPMSEVAGRMSIQIGATLLQKNTGGSGILLGGVPGTLPATVVIVGAGTAGSNAALMAAGLGAKTFILDNNLERLRALSEILPKNATTLISNPSNIRTFAQKADLLISSILIPGAKTPKLISRDVLRVMKASSVVIDIAIDQGGSLETSRPTDLQNPTYVEEGIIHYCVTNIPSAVPITSTIALNNATFPYLELIANFGWEKACKTSPALAKGLNIVKGQITHLAVAEAFKFPCTPWRSFS